jgi:hypothetical protein
MTWCGFKDGYERFGRACCFQHHDRRFYNSPIDLFFLHQITSMSCYSDCFFFTLLCASNDYSIFQFMIRVENERIHQCVFALLLNSKQYIGVVLTNVSLTSNLSTRQNFSHIFGINSIHAERIMCYKPFLVCK